MNIETDNYQVVFGDFLFQSVKNKLEATFMQYLHKITFYS